MVQDKKINADKCLRLLVGEGGFEPPKSVTTDLQSAPFGRSGIPPYLIWSWWTDSNPRPADYKSAALPAELHQQFQQRYLSYQNIVHLSTDFFAFLQYFLGGIGLNKRNCSARRVVRCTLCGREIIMNEEYWCCNGAQVCAGCLPELARRELWPCREIRGREACR